MRSLRTRILAAALEVVAEVQAFVDRTGSIEGVTAVLDQIHQRTQALLIRLRDGRAIAAAPTMPSTIEISSDGVTLTIVDDSRHSEFALGGPLPAIVGADGEPLGSLVVLPAGWSGRLSN